MALGRRGGFRSVAGLFTCASLVLVACLAISPQSFWIDEAGAAWRATEPSLSGLLDRMLTDRGSDAQMPLYLFLLWIWEKLVGHGEWALRSFNLIWFLPGAYIFINGRPERIASVLLSPFVWYCLDEARPYGMQLGASLLVFGLLERAVIAADRHERVAQLLRPSESWLLLIGLVALAGSTLLGAIWATAAIGAVVFSISWRHPGLLRAALSPPNMLLLAILSVLGGYYLWTIWVGAGGTRVAVTDLRTMAFIVYEQMGLAGLGPGRGDLRADGAAALEGYGAVLGLFTLIAGIVTLVGLAHVARAVPRQVLLSVALAVILAASLILIAGIALHWRVVGRHMTPFMPILLATQACGMRLLWRGGIMGEILGRCIVVAFLGLSIASAGSLRLSQRHAKDDYRAAAALALEALSAGERVVWNADALSAMIYGLRLGNGCSGALLQDANVGLALPAVPPTLVLSSKPDIYDPQGVFAGYLSAGGYRRILVLPAFEVWQSEQGLGCAS